MRQYRKTIAALAGAILVAGLAGYASARTIDGVVATVDEEPITLSEVREAVAEGMNVPQGDADAWLREERDSARIVKWIAPLVDSLVVRKALAGAGAAVDNAAVDGAVASVRKSNNMTEDEFSQALVREGITMAAYRRRIRWQMERGNIVRVRKMKEVTVADDEVKAYFSEQSERFREGAEVRFETLLIPMPTEGADTGEKTIRLRLAAQQAIESLRGGRSMTETAALVGTATPGVRLIASDLMKTDDLAADLARELHKLRTGETSAPFFNEEGARIVRLLERKGGKLPEFSTLKEALTEELTDRRSEKAFTELMDELRKAASIEIRL
ncbi:MAG TPA: SurA N-terminal domain-containing protein [Candidatus Deferrimicrobiaceae bacterium]|jgi:peptidyl-prolyl cis-trans isomerase SurA